MENPYKLIKSKDIYKNPWISVREDAVIRPDGTEGIFGIVTIVPGVSVLPIDDEGNAYLIKEFRYAMEDYTVQNVAGGIDAGEEPLDAAKRELREETGIVAEEWIDLGHISLLTTIANARTHLFIAKNLTFGKAGTEEQSVIEVIKMPFAQAVDKVLKNEIICADSNALILRAQNYLKK